MIENFSSRVLQNWGLGYEEMREIKPDIVYVSMSGYGHTGRNHHYTTFGPVAQAVSGLTHLSGLPGKPPAGWGWSYMDDTGGMYGAMCALTGLYHRNKHRPGPAHRSVADGLQRAAQRPRPARLHGQRPALAARGLPAGQPRALAGHAAPQQLPRPDRRAAQRLPHRIPAATTTGA